MHTITLSYPVFSIFCLLFVVAVGGACTLFALVKNYRRDNATLSRIYNELLVGSGKRESDLLKELTAWRLRAAAAETTSDRLAPVVTQYLKDIDDTAALLKDPAPPAMTAAREAIRLHQKSTNLRSIHAPTPLREEEPAQTEV